MSPKRKKKRKKSRKYYGSIVIPNPVYTGFFDGSCEPVNPGGNVAYGGVIYQHGTQIWTCSERFYPAPGQERHTSNNLGEYCGLIAVLTHLRFLGAQHEPIMIYGDSRLVINQMAGIWRIKAGIYVPFARQAQVLWGEFTALGCQWIPRDRNTIADALSKAPGRHVEPPA